MCGIAGIFNPRGFQIKELKKLNDIIKHRGPDDEGYLILDYSEEKLQRCNGEDTIPSISNYYSEPNISSISNNQAIFGLAHRRLSIIDLSPAGHQPMSYDDGNYWLVFNGEIYNYIEIKRQLQQKGYIFLSDSDSEVILAAWKEWGVESLNHFVGMWAFILFDKNLNKLFITRDRYGIKPLYYWISANRTIYFASEIKQFTCLSNWEASLNSQRAQDYLLYSFTDHTNETLFNNVFHIPPGNYFQIDINKDVQVDKKGKISTIKWYQPKANTFVGSYEDAKKSFRDLFFESIKIHLRSDVGIGSALSGGLDSSSIVCCANILLRSMNYDGLQKTFSYINDYEGYTEKKWIDEVINHTKVDPHFVNPSSNDAINMANELIWFMDEPYQSQSAFVNYQICKLAKNQNVKVLMSGQGADEYLSGYGEFNAFKLANFLRKGNFRGFINNLEGTNIHQKSIHIKSTLDYIYNIKKYKGLSQLESSLLPLLNEDFIKNNRIYSQPKMNSILEIANFQLMENPLPKYLRWEDRNSMANSIEGRFPFLDHRIIEFSTNLPIEFLDKKYKRKNLLIESLKEFLPKSIANRKDKVGFMTPEEVWIKKEFTSKYKELLDFSITNSNGIITENATKYFYSIVDGKIPFSNSYWRLILFGIWMNKFKVKPN
jgi:asparagine synthase (glutamine-hydrolysing)